MAENDEKMSAEDFEKLSTALMERLGSIDPKTHCDVVQRITDTWLDQIKTKEVNNPLFAMVAPLLYLYGHMAMHQAFEYGIEYERQHALPDDFDDLSLEDLTNGE